MNILNFRIRGKMAHFRRYYSNSSALSYSVPPRTTLIGLIAGLLGYERDSYYELFDPEQCHVSVGIRSPQKKIIHTMNLLMIKKPNDFNGSQPFHSQTPTEIISPVQIRSEYLDYEVWFHHKDQTLMEILKSQICLKYGYLSRGVSAALGTAQHIGWIEQGREVNGKKIGEIDAEIESVIPRGNLNNIDFSNHSRDLYILKEDLPIHFHNDRTLASKGDFIINSTPWPVKASVKQAVQLSDNRFITWMEA